MKEFDQLATSFITPFGSYCYVMMSFGLKNARATYQQCVLKCFKKLIGQTIEVYVDNIVVKSKRTDQLVADLKLAFKMLRENGIKLNSEKCVFRVPGGMLLGFIISKRGIEANPEKIEANMKMGSI
jgi:hypothetical protein